MKKITLKAVAIFGVALFTLSTSQAQTKIVSSLGGNWTNPSTWDCTCVPQPGDSIRINHGVSLDTDFSYSAGEVLIYGSLTKSDPSIELHVNGGKLVIYGTLDVGHLHTQSGQLTFAGTTRALTLINEVNFSNAGTITNVDTLYTSGNINNLGSIINVDTATIDASLSNLGTFKANKLSVLGSISNSNTIEVDDVTNSGDITNSNMIKIFNNGLNTASWDNNISGTVEVHGDFTNHNSSTNDAELDNAGTFESFADFYNMDVMKGSSFGTYTVHEVSNNSGSMEGSFEFCDLTPPPSSPYIDQNTGTIAPTITFCEFTSTKNVAQISFEIYPNPATDMVNIQTFGSVIRRVAIHDMQGRQVMERQSQNDVEAIDVSMLNEGIYFIVIDSNTGISTHKIQVLR